MASKEIRKNSSKQEGNEEHTGKAVPGMVEVTVRVMGENGEWTERSVRTDSGVSIGTFDVSSREGYLDCFDCLEQAIIQARNEVSRETAEAFLKEVGKKTENVTSAIQERFLESELGVMTVPVHRAVSKGMRNTEHLWSRNMVKIMEMACIENTNRIACGTVNMLLHREGSAQSLKLRTMTDLCDHHGKEVEEYQQRQAKKRFAKLWMEPGDGIVARRSDGAGRDTAAPERRGAGQPDCLSDF